MFFFFLEVAELVLGDSNIVNCVTAAKSLENQKQFCTPRNKQFERWSEECSCYLQNTYLGISEFSSVCF